MARTALLAFLAALAACTAERAPADRAAEPSTPVSSDSPLPPSAPVPARAASADEIWGQWRLVSLSGAETAGGHRIHLLIGRLGIEAVSQCVPFDLKLPFPTPPLPPRRQSDPPEAVCARGLSPTEQLFPQLIQAAQRVERRPEGRIAFVGRRGEAVLERPDEPVTNPFENAPGPGPWAMWGEWRVAEIGGRPVEGEPIRLLFGRRTVEAMSGCVAMLWRLGQLGAQLSFERVTWPAGVCERMKRSEESALEAVLSGEVAIARSTPTERLLAGRGGSLLLRR